MHTSVAKTLGAATGAPALNCGIVGVDAHSTASWRLLAIAVSILICVGWTLGLGKDLHWDAVNYHLYLGFSALNDRFGLDFFAAGTPSYVNPYAHIPLYLMWRAEWPALSMAVAFAAFHAATLWLSFELALVAGRRRKTDARGAFAMVALLLASTNPVLLQTVGSTITDPSVAVVVLAGWLAIARALRGGQWRMVALAGVLCGLATTLKLSNAVFAVAAVPALLFMPGSPALRARGIAVYCAACGLSFVLTSLPWSWQLWREFGNPFFPFLNEHFHSPDFITTPLKQERFVPLTWQAFLLRPFEMLLAESAVHVEPRAPDLRYAVLATALFALVATILVRPASGAANGMEDGEDSAADRCFIGLLTGLAVAWCLWLAMSGNSRYFLGMACVASVVLALVLQRLYVAWPFATKTAILLAFAVQGVQLFLGSDLRRDGYEWEGPWLRVEIPDKLRNEPHFFIAPGIQSGSIFAPYLHEDSGWMNVAGFYVIGPHHPGGERAQRLIERNADRLRFILGLPEGVVSRATLPSPPDNLRAYFRRFGLRVDGSDCEFLRLEGNVRGERRPLRDKWKHFISCRLVPAPEERIAYERAVEIYDVIFDRVEDTCPLLFFPRRPVTQEARYWSRTYHSGSEMQLFVDRGRVMYFYYLRGGDPIDIGSVDEWLAGPKPFDCSVRTSPAFVNVTAPGAR